MALLKKKKQEIKEEVAAKAEAEPKVEKKTIVKPAAKKAVAKKKSKRGISKKALTIFVRPLVTEKTAALSDKNVMVFEVARGSNRVEIKNAFNELYGVVPTKVNVLNMRGKRVLFGRVIGKRKDWRKAMITLPKGVNVDIFEGI